MRRLAPLWLWLCLACAEGAPPTLYSGGPILTMDAENRVVEALAIEGERIVGVGSLAELEGWAQERGATRVDLAGRALIPGFIDAHGHFPGAGLATVHLDVNSPPIGDVRNFEDLLARVRQRAEETSVWTPPRRITRSHCGTSPVTSRL
jgi:predicted amidohydrolase YtcJ